jgi:hypothetical protein
MAASASIRALVALTSLVAFVGCSKAGDESGFATKPGQSVAVEGLSFATLASHGGGFSGPRPQGAACDPGVWSYELALDAGTLSWSLCQVANSGQAAADYTPVTGWRALSASEQTDAERALRDVRVSARMTCGADKGSWDLTVTSPDGTLTYGDDFYACQDDYDHFVEGLDGLADVLSQLAGG